jgi:hypothetical protein
MGLTMLKKQSQIMLSELDYGQVGFIAAYLNGQGSENLVNSPLPQKAVLERWRTSIEELKCLVNRWKASGPNLQKMLQDDSILQDAMIRSWEVGWLATDGARAHFVPRPTFSIRKLDATPKQVACYLFASLVLLPDCERLGGPCPGCQMYFVCPTEHVKTYCSRACRSGLTARKSLATSRAAKLDQRLKWARAGIKEWSLRQQGGAWKNYIVRYVRDRERDWAQRKNKREPDPIHEKSISHWVNAGLLQEPKPAARPPKR